MFRINSLICIALLLTTASSNGFQEPVVDNVAISVTEAANIDAISNEDLAIWYSVYRGTYLYGTKFNFDEAKNFGQIFDKQIKVRNKLLPSKTDKLKNVINGVFKKYEELPFDDNSKNQFLEECNSVTKGLKNAID